MAATSSTSSAIPEDNSKTWFKLKILGLSANLTDPRNFYRDLIGLTEIDKPEALKTRGGVWFALGEQQLHLGVEDSLAAARKAHPGIHCTNLESLAHNLASANYPVNWDTTLPSRKRFYTQDPFGNRLEFLDSCRHKK